MLLTGSWEALRIPWVAVDAGVARYTGRRAGESLTTALCPCCALGEGGCSKGYQSQQRRGVHRERQTGSKEGLRKKRTTSVRGVWTSVVGGEKDEEIVARGIFLSS